MSARLDVREMFSTEAEQAVLGAALASPEALLELQAQGLGADEFHLPAHRTIWLTIGRIAEAGGAVDPITVADDLAAGGRLDSCGGLAYLGALMSEAVSPGNAVAYAQRVRERRHERDWFRAGREICEIMQAGDGATHEQRIQRVQQLVTALATEQAPRTQFALREAVDRFVSLMREAHAHPGIHGVCTGFKHVDFRLQGLQPGDLLVIAGRPAMGKTTYAMNIAHHAAAAQGKRVMVFSLEMSAHQLAMRMTAAHGPIKMGLLKSGRVLEYPDQGERLVRALSALSALPIVIDEQGGITLADLAARARREHRQGALGLIVIDYLQLLEGSNARASRNDAVSDISRGLKSLAKELGCPVIVLSQLSRKCEERGNKRPIPSDLRDSGAIEQDADMIQFVYRDKVYNDATPVGDQAEIITSKLRNGEPGTDYLAFDGAHNRFLEAEATASYGSRRSAGPYPDSCDDTYSY